MTTKYQLAQLNIARLLAPLDSPQLADFVGNLDRINALAEQSPGFIWRLLSEADQVSEFGDDVIVNLSVWADLQSLHNFVFRSAHIEIMRRRKEWFSPMSHAHLVLWWVPAGHRPTEAEARARLGHLHEHGATAYAFGMKDQAYTAQAPDQSNA